MTEPSLPELEAERERLYAQLSAVGDFRRGSVSENYRKCGKPNCACAQPGHPGHGPRFLWTRTARGRGTVGRQLAAGEVDKVRREVARHAEFAAVSEQIVEVNETICEARPSPPGAAGGDGAPPCRRGKRGLRDALARERRRRDSTAGRGSGPVAGLRRRAGGGGGGDPGRDAEAGRRHAGEAAGRRSRAPRPAGAVRAGPRGGVRRLPGQGDRHGARPGHPLPRLVPLRGLRARAGAPRRRARRGRAVDVSGPGRDDRPGRGGRAVREGRAGCSPTWPGCS